jgi:hypothetical protein
MQEVHLPLMLLQLKQLALQAMRLLSTCVVTLVMELL